MIEDPRSLLASTGREALRHDSPARIDIKTLPPAATFLRILGVNYVHLKTADDADLYLTEHGVPFLDHLMPENWYEEQWFTQKRERLAGTSTVYRVPTRPLPGRTPRSLDLVVKWSRVGQDVPLDTFTMNKVINAEFNTPFEEFSLLEELRAGKYGPPDLKILTQKPLAIYVPPEKMQLWQTGRSKNKILSKIARHPGIEIDILRSYILLYGWIKGYNAVEAYQAIAFDPQQQQREVIAITNLANHELEQKGFMVADNKPTHIIVRVEDGKIRRDANGELVYALIDYELLARTPPHDEAVKKSNRSRYLMLQRDRFHPKDVDAFPVHLRPARVHEVDFIYGRTESTGGALWVVGKDPELFSYFLPERWRTRQVQLSQTKRTYYTQTKDRIHLVWKVSRVGELPPGNMDDPAYDTLLAYGFNSPFEEFDIALQLQHAGVKTVYPRAIYMTGQQTDMAGCIIDERRFRHYGKTLSPEALPILPMDHDYITIWGYWRGLEDTEATSDQGYWNSIDASSAAAKGIISAATLDELISRQKSVLKDAGFEDLMLRGDHILLTYIPDGVIKKDKQGQIELRHCNLEMVRKIPPAS